MRDLTLSQQLRKRYLRCLRLEAKHISLEEARAGQEG